jgi:hypothetical protein
MLSVSALGSTEKIPAKSIECGHSETFRVFFKAWSDTLQGETTTGSRPSWAFQQHYYPGGKRYES